MSKKLTTEIFVEKAIQKHGKKYDYSKVIYTHSDNKVIIICNVHGDFKQRPINFLNGKGCSKCSNKVPTNKEFINKAKSVHGNKYDYSLVKYTKINSLVNIKCSIHGFFKQNANVHLSGHGCKKCTYDNMKLNINDIIIRFKNIHGNKYDYSKVNYAGFKTKIKIICKKHGEFQQRPDSHLKGRGCIKCANIGGWSFIKWKNKILNNKNTIPKLYVLKCYNDTEEFIKIGITMYDIKKRYHNKIQMPYKFNILLDINSTPELVFKNEELAHSNFKNVKYNPKLKFDGISECYNIKSKKEIINYCKSIF